MLGRQSREKEDDHAGINMNEQDVKKAEEKIKADISLSGG